MQPQVAILICLFISGVLSISCKDPPSTYCGRTNCNIWYIDPINGKTNNSGTFDSPWRNLTEVFEKNLLETRTNLDTSYPVDSFEPQNPGAPVKAGDVFVLRSGNHSKISYTQGYNELPITIVREPGASIYVNTISLNAVSNWRLYCLTVRPINPDPDSSILSVSESWRGPSYDVWIENNEVFSYTNLASYKDNKKGLFDNSSPGIYALGTRIYIRGNYIHHVKRGVQLRSTNSTLERNFVNYILADGFRIMNNNTLVEGNLIQNSMNVDNNADHRDCMQMFTNGNTVGLKNIIIRNNRCFASQDPTRPFAAPFQGITSFDVPINNVTIENNLIVTNLWHGITMLFANNTRILSNTLVSTNTEFDIWIQLKSNMSVGNLIQNNFAAKKGETSGVTIANNFFKTYNVTDLQRWFVDPLNFNFRVKEGAPFIGMGEASAEIPTTDLAGRTRKGEYDCGCYDFDPSYAAEDVNGDPEWTVEDYHPNGTEGTSGTDTNGTTTDGTTTNGNGTTDEEESRSNVLIFSVFVLLSALVISI